MNWIAKKIIASPPFSVEFGSGALGRAASLMKKVDGRMQSWALDRSDRFSEQDWRDVQTAKLKGILAHAARNVPFWRELFGKNDLKPDFLFCPGDVRRLPVISRADAKLLPLRAWLAENVERSRSEEVFTSGSTGEPLRFLEDARDRFRRRVNTGQEFRYLGRSLASPVIKFDLSTRGDLDGIGVRINPRDLEFKERRVSVVYPVFASSPKSILMTTPSYLERFAFFCARDGYAPDIDCIMHMGEQLAREQEAEFEKFFRCPLFSTYATMECSLIGIQCEKKNFHVAPWMNYVEIVNDRREPLPDGEEGDIVVTLFENEAMPFVRYAIGDVGRYKRERCGCGRSSKTIEFAGRRGGNIVLPGGAAYPVLHLFHLLALRYSAEIKRLQIEQGSPSSLVVRVVPADGGSGVDAQGLEGLLRRELGSALSLRVEVLPWIRPNANGKTPHFIPLLDQRKSNSFLRERREGRGRS